MNKQQRNKKQKRKLELSALYWYTIRFHKINIPPSCILSSQQGPDLLLTAMSSDLIQIYATTQGKQKLLISLLIRWPLDRNSHVG